MEANSDRPSQKDLDAWIKQRLGAAVRRFIDQGDIDSPIVEAKPAWVLPFQILIGKIRTQGQSKDSAWFICGEIPTDYLTLSVAATPRECAKHFVMKWQLAAARHQDRSRQNPPTITSESQQKDPAKQLVGYAEALYEVVEDDRLWLQGSIH